MNPSPRKMLSFPDASALSLPIIDLMAPLCKDGRCTVAGALRRKQSWVESIDIVCLPLVEDVETPEGDQLTRQNKVLAFFEWESKRNHGLTLVKSGPRYINALIGSTQLRVYMPLQSQWGRILALRTGPRLYSIKLATRWKELGYVGNGELEPVSGEGIRPSFPTEKDFYQFLNWTWIEPAKRR